MKHQNTSNLPMIILISFVGLLVFISLFVLLDHPLKLNIFGNTNKDMKQEQQINEYEIFDVEPITLTDEEKQYKWSSKEVYWVRLHVDEEQIEKYIENFKFVVWIIEKCWIHDQISNKWNKYSDTKLEQLNWLKWKTVENQVHILKSTWIDFYADRIIKKCYAQAKKEKSTKNLSWYESNENDNLIRTLEDFQHLRIELWLTTFSI